MRVKPMDKDIDYIISYCTAYDMISLDKCKNYIRRKIKEIIRRELGEYKKQIEKE